MNDTSHNVFVSRRDTTDVVSAVSAGGDTHSQYIHSRMHAVAEGRTSMAQWAYKVVYIDYRGHISCEGQKTFIGNERRSAFARSYMNTLGHDGWELVGIQPLTSNSAYYVFKRPAQEGDYADQTPPASAEQQTPPSDPTPPSGSPTVESA
jgi:hypothetical protein